VARLGLGDARRLYKLDQPDLRRVISILGRRLQLRNHAWAGLQHRNGMHLALLVEDLRHADLFTQNSRDCHSSLTSSCEAVRVALPEYSS
jgi:hypothetical protein